MAFIESLGRQTISIFHQLGAIILLLIATVKEIGTIRSRETFKQCLSLGVLSFPIVALTLLFTGMVLSVQIAGELTKYGADFTVGAIVAIGIGRELGPVLCGVVLAGRVGAAITAEIGTMRVTEQIDALRCMAVSPIGYLVVPRLVACGNASHTECFWRCNRCRRRNDCSIPFTRRVFLCLYALDSCILRPV